MEEIFNNIFYFESNFFELLERKNIDDILQRTNIYDQYMFVIPKHIQIRDVGHWVFFIFFPKRKSNDVVDDNLLINSNIIIELNSIPSIQVDYQDIKSLLLKFWKHKFPNELLSKEETRLKLIRLINTPKQSGSINCGPYCCYFVHKFLSYFPEGVNELQFINFDANEALMYRYYLLDNFDSIYNDSLVVNEGEMKIDFI